MIENKKEYIENFFISMMDSKFCGTTSYLEMPSNNSFKFCIKEILYCLEKKDKEDKIRDYTLQAYRNFYEFMIKDKIFKEVNDFEYRNLMIRLKNYSENNNSIDSQKQQKSYFERLNKRYSKDYKNKCYEILLKMYSDNSNIDAEKLYNISLTFLNELLAYKMNYMFISFALSLYKSGKFISFTQFIKYLHYQNIDNMEIYIPIQRESEKDIEFLTNNSQEIVKIDETTYCKTFKTRMIDFFSWVEKQVIRIESIFNTLRFYTKSEMDFDLDQNIIVHSTFFNENILIKFREVISYTNKTLNYKNLENLLYSLNKLKSDDEDVEGENELDEELSPELNKKLERKQKRKNSETNENRRILYYKLLNILSFVERDKDLLNHNSFVDNWTALETLCGLSKLKIGYDSVKYIIPKIITPKIILYDINDTFYRAFHSKRIILKAENFINLSKNGKFDYTKIKDPYLNFKLKKYEKIISSINNFESYIKGIEKSIEYDLMRIYIIRNEYAHESNLNVFNSMQQYKLKTLLPLVLDEFFRTMNNIIDHYDSSEGLAFDVFDDLLLRYRKRENAFMLLNNGLKINNGGIDLKIRLEDAYDINESDLIFNILKNNNDIMKKYLGKEDY